MPTYSYACSQCGHSFDIYQSFSDEALNTCPECHGALRKKFSAVGVVFKGSGFYRNDARSSSGETSSPSNGSKSDDSSSSSEKSSSSSGSEASKSSASNGSASDSGGGSGSSSKGSGASGTKSTSKAAASV